MPWARFGDNAATYPQLLAVAGLSGVDERTVNELTGWLWRCMIQSAAHMTDYRVDLGTAAMVGGSRTTTLIELATKVGLVTRHDDGNLTWLETVKDPEFVHIRLKQEIEWERQERNDTRNPALAVPVRARDGDQCRWCGVLVQWRGRTSARTGTLDHLKPGVPGTVETMVVACKSCNSSRKDSPQWEDDHPLRPQPKTPVFGPVTAEYLTAAGRPTGPTEDALRPGTQPGNAEAEPPRARTVQGLQRPGNQPGNAPSGSSARVVDSALRPGNQPGNAQSAPDQPENPAATPSARDGTGPPKPQNAAQNSITQTDRMNSAGSGRELISGRVSDSGLVASSTTRPARKRRKRRRRKC